MQELELKQALRDEMSLVTRPEPMRETEVLDAAKRALRRRRGAWASAGSVVAVVALTVGTVFTATGDSRPGTSAGTEPTTPLESGTISTPPVVTSGPHYERAAALLSQLREVVPPGFDILQNIPPDADYLEGHFAEFRDTGSQQWWQYIALTTVTSEGRYGRILVMVSTPDNDFPSAQGCELTLPRPESSPTSTCQEVLVDGVLVGVATNQNMNGIQSAVYRHRDGTVVFLEQDHAAFEASFPILTELPWTVQQLAELAADPRWHVN